MEIVRKYNSRDKLRRSAVRSNDQNRASNGSRPQAFRRNIRKFWVSLGTKRELHAASRTQEACAK
jgi:hypothetical protein